MYGPPKSVLEHFARGAFVSSIKSHSFSSVAIDEAYEMLINKDCKNSLSHSLPVDMHKISQTLEFQAELIANFQHQLSHVKTKVQQDHSPTVIANELANAKMYSEKNAGE